VAGHVALRRWATVEVAIAGKRQQQFVHCLFQALTEQVRSSTRHRVSMCPNSSKIVLGWAEHRR
jgi:hypothetical protein